MSQAQSHAWWADVEHLREAAERRQAAAGRRRSADWGKGRAPESPEAVRARIRAAGRVRAASGVDELTARRAVALDDRSPRPRRPAPIWLAEDAFGDPIANARARASAPRRTVEIRGQIAGSPAAPASAATRSDLARRAADRPLRRERASAGTSLGSAIAGRPDRIAFWAFALGLLLAVAAAASPH